MMDFDAYRQRIGFMDDAPPTLGTLSKLIARHAAAIPFENVDVLAGRVPALDLPSLHAKLVAGRRGGYCFEQNTLLMAVLQHLGFAVQGMEGRVRAGVPADVVTARTHMALRVTIDGQAWLVDVGFGALAPMAPLKLGVSDGEQEAGGGIYRFVDESRDDLLLQALTHEGWSDCYRLTPSLPHPIDYELGNWWVATHPGAMLRHNLLVARAVEGGRMTLFNHTLTVRRPQTAAPEQRTLSGKAEITDVLTAVFGLQIDAADLDAVMRCAGLS
jgi:N-hydroxyarylamine O-acetyltransferase